MPMINRFRAVILPKFRQGDHVVIAVFYRTDEGEDRRVTTTILPEKIANEYVELINGPSAGSPMPPSLNVTSP